MGTTTNNNTTITLREGGDTPRMTAAAEEEEEEEDRPEWVWCERCSGNSCRSRGIIWPRGGSGRIRTRRHPSANHQR